MKASPGKARVVIVLPAYNAEKTLQTTLEEIPGKYRSDIILVDDASTDQTVALARKLGLKCFVHPVNKGYGANQKTCYRNALALDPDIVVMVHPDHQYDARVIPDMIYPIMRGEADAVFGSRMLGGRPLESGMPWWKYVANIFLTALANVVFTRYLSEIHSGFRAYSRKYLETVRFEENRDDFVFDTEIIAQGMACNLFFKEVAIETRYFKEASSINFGRSTLYGIEIVITLFRYFLHRNKIIRAKQFLPKSSDETGLKSKA
jgi:glycosyltransferase involved in cell wall biosynthesis